MADSTEETQDAPVQKVPESAPAGPPKSGMLFIIIIGFLVIILTPLISFFVVKSASPAAQAPPETPEQDNENPVLELEVITVNIARTKATRVVRFKPHLVLSQPELEEHMQAATPMLMDRISMAASRRTVDELEGPEGRTALKRDIMSEVNSAIKDKMAGAVIDVFFSEFLIQ